MKASLSGAAQLFLKEKVWAHLATLMEDGSPQVTPVWVDTDGTNVIINTAANRIKTRNLERDGRVAISIMGMESAYRTLYVRGKVKTITTLGANSQIDSLSFRYTGNAQYQGHREGETRVLVIIEPEHITERGMD